MESVKSPVSPVLSYTLEEDAVVLPVGKGKEVEAEGAKEEFVEPLLKPDPLRFVLFPIQNHVMYQHYKNHVAVFWTPEEIDLSKDLKDWIKLTDNERHFIRNILGFFGSVDTVIMENIVARFMNDVQMAEARQFYAVQLMMEAIHSETYSLLIDTYIEDKDEKEHLFNAIQTIPCIKAKGEWAQRWIASQDESFATRLIAFAVVEGIYFSGAFCSIYWLKDRGLMPGLTTSNELIARDENLHVAAAVSLYEEIVQRVPKAKVHKIIKEAVDIEIEFITESLPCSLIGMNATLMTQYIKFVADRLSTQLGYGKIYHSSNPFDFMEKISMQMKTNMFEGRVTSYAKSGVGKTANEMSFSLDTDF
jgi:ribonucleoside-diphosphate reductase beta chain